VSGITLTLDVADSWDTNDTVIKLLVDPASIPQLNFALHKPIPASSSVEFGPAWGTTTPWGRVRLVDGQVAAIPSTNGWSAGNYGWSSAPTDADHPEWVSVDLEAPCWVNKVRLHPRNDGANPGYGFPISFDISTSTDGTHWCPAVSLTNQPRPTTPQTFTFSTRPARYLRVAASQLRPNPNDGGTYCLQFSELEVFGLAALSSLGIEQVQNSVVLHWTNGILQSADNATGSFADVPAAVSPFTNAANLPKQFYRLRH
jgi:hypothetical protein